MKAIDFILGQPWAITDDVLNTITTIALRQNESPEAVAAKLGRPLDNARTVTKRDGVASIPVVGPIFRYANLFTEISGATSTDVLSTDFQAALDDPNVSAILLEVDSPGGQATGIGELANRIFEARGKKPIVAYVSGAGCSAAYYLGAAADAVVVAPMSAVGSIGVLFSMDRRKAGKDPLIIKSRQSPRKALDPETEEGQADLQAHADALCEVFIADVARFRGVSPEAVVSDFGGGGVMVGAAAVRSGLADSVGSYEQVLADLSRGVVPRRKAEDPKPAPKAAHSQPRRAAMSEPNQTANAADPSASTVDYKAMYEAEARKHAESRAAVAVEVKQRIDAQASAFATEVIAGNKAVHAERDTIASAFAQAAQDDHDHPMAGKPAARQDQVRAIYAARAEHTLTRPVAASDPANKGRALPQDPAGAASAQSDDLDGIGALARSYGERLNGVK